MKNNPKKKNKHLHIGDLVIAKNTRDWHERRYKKDPFCKGIIKRIKKDVFGNLLIYLEGAYDYFWYAERYNENSAIKDYILPVEEWEEWFNNKLEKALKYE